LAYNSQQQKLKDKVREEENDAANSDPEAKFDMTGRYYKNTVFIVLSNYFSC
jgi:hypothetical protein